MKALVVFSPYDCEDAYLNLQLELEKEGIELIKVTNEIYHNPSTFLDGKETVLFYRNPYIRYSNAAGLLRFSKEHNFDIVTFFKEFIVIRDGFSCPNTKFFKTSNTVVYYYNPNVEETPIIVVGHRRLDYLKLALNSILFSLQLGENTPILIGLSETTSELRDYCLEKSKIHKNIKVFETVENSYLTIVNLILQKEKIEKFIIIEEDYIMPQTTKFIYPFWTKQYSNLLKNFDLVTQMTDLSNLPYDFFDPTLVTDKEFGERHKSNFYVNRNISCIGSGMGMKTSWYQKILKESPDSAIGDGYIKQKSRKTVQLNIQGYHIGWNQEMDGYKKLSDFSRFSKTKDNYDLIDYSTGKLENFNIK